MEIDELKARLDPFLQHHLDDPGARVTEIGPGGGHAGFAYLFDVESRGNLLRYWMRLPPPNVKLEGTADVLRQVTVLKALDGTDVPHAELVWSGDDPRWFGRPYFVVKRIDGDVLRGDYVHSFTDIQRESMARQAMIALAAVHRLDWRETCSYLGNFWGFEFDITRWDRFYERGAEQERLTLQPRVRQLLLDSIPHDAHIGVYHGDFQYANTMFSADAKLQALIDWELTGIGATLNDIGWISAFSDARAWGTGRARSGEGLMPEPAALEAMYAEAWGEPLRDLGWFKALAAYKFGIITGFNLMLHRRGKRDDPHWEESAESMQPLMEYAMGMLSS